MALDSKIIPGKTRNIFVDTTATDKTKLLAGEITDMESS